VELCDGTQVKLSELRPLFKMSPAQLASFVLEKKIELRVLCEPKGVSAPFASFCRPFPKIGPWKEVTQLHGQFLPLENAIIIRAGAFPGSLVHEYIHAMQFANRNLKRGHVYKQERIRVQKALIDELDLLIAQTKKLEAAGKEPEARKLLPRAIALSDDLLKFGFWQKVIDERNIFFLYSSFGTELGIAARDVELARKNLGFLCADPAMDGARLAVFRGSATSAVTTELLTPAFHLCQRTLEPLE